MEPILLTHWRSPGDIVCMTACVRDLALTYPGRYEIHVAGSYPELWQHNPHIAKAWGSRPPGKLPRYLLDCCAAMAEANQLRRHYLAAFHRDLSQKLGIPIPVLYPKPDLHLDDWEQNTSLLEGPYWIVFAAGKTDMPIKVWSAARFQQAVDILQRHGVRCVQAGSTATGHTNPTLDDVESLVGKTDLRTLLRLVDHAEGVLCGVSLPMHLAAAFDKPAVVLAGGREPRSWCAYINSPERPFGEGCAPIRVPHRLLPKFGQLPPCGQAGCWRQFVDAEQTEHQEALCKRPLREPDGTLLPSCLHMVTPQDVADAVLHYLGTLQRQGERVVA